MLKLFLLTLLVIVSIHCAPTPQRDDVEVQDRSSSSEIGEAEFDYKFTLDDGHERQQQRRDIDGVHVVIGFYKYIDPDGKEQKIYYKADEKGYQISYNKPFDFPSNNDLESQRLSSAYLPPAPSQNLIRDVLSKPSAEYLPPSNSYLPPN